MIDLERNRSLCIHPQYDHRPDPAAFDDRPMRDEWQDAVYRYARDFAVQRHFRRVLDMGCGSGFKLMKYFSGFETVGYEIDPALDYLMQTYPHRQWQDGRDITGFTGDILICADVVEHLADPIELLKLFSNSPLQYLMISTPALEILSEREQSPRLGPPDNQSHYNEWTTREFRDFCNMHLRVIDHIVVSAEQGTQLIVAQPR